MVKLLFLMSLSFLFLSSSAAALLGIQALRVVLFSLTVLSLCAAAIMLRPGFPSRGRDLPVVLFFLLAIIALSDVGGTFHLFDYKIALPILVLFAAPNLAQSLDGVELERNLLWVLTLYMLVMGFSLVAGGSNVVERGYDAFVRYDMTGSIVTHSSLCAIYILVAGATIAGLGARRSAPILFIALIAAAIMLLMTATRTALLTLAIYPVLSVLAGPERAREMRRFALMLTAGLVLFGAYTILVSDAFFLRIVSGDQADYTSGRWHSIVYWLDLSDGNPLGLGLGAVSEMLADGRPYIDGERLLEWPHNEYIRYYVEAGVPGLFLVLGLVGGLVHRAVTAAASETDPARRALMLAIAADMVTQTMLQNYFNTIYHATVMIMLLAICADRSLRGSALVQPLSSNPARLPMSAGGRAQA